MTGFFNIFSFVLAAASLILPIIPMVKKSADPRFSNLSYGFCIVALASQIGQLCSLIERNDWAALLDTYAFVGKMSLILMAVVIALNILSYHLTKKFQK